MLGGILLTDTIVLLNEIKNFLSQTCEGAIPWAGLGKKPHGSTLNEICDKLYFAKKEDIERLLTLETQTFYFNRENLCWIMYPEIVDSVKKDISNRRNRMIELYNSNKLSRFISSDSYKKILLFRIEDFNRILERCEKIAECDSNKIHLPPTEIWDMILYSSDKEFSKRISIMKNSTIKNSEHFSLLLSMTYLSKTLSDIENRITNLENKRKSKSQDYKIQFADFVIKGHIFKCNANHTIEQIQALVDIMTPSGAIITEKISAGYCCTCNCYFILEIDFNRLRDKGIVLCQQITYETYRKNGLAIMNGEDLKPESLLHQSGYNVSATEDLSSYQRQEILRRVVDNGLYTVSGICSHLDWLIGRNKKVTNRDMSCAIAKWEEDRVFISTYKTNTQRNVGVKSIKRKV